MEFQLVSILNFLSPARTKHFDFFLNIGPEHYDICFEANIPFDVDGG